MKALARQAELEAEKAMRELLGKSLRQLVMRLQWVVLTCMVAMPAQVEHVHIWPTASGCYIIAWLSSHPDCCVVVRIQL